MGKRNKKENRSTEDYKTRFLEQWNLLREEVQGFYAGNISEALNIAMRLRIFFEKNSKMLSTFNQNYRDLEIADYREIELINGQEHRILSRQPRIKFGPKGPAPAMPDVRSTQRVTLSRWWEGPLLFGDGKLSRNIVVDHVCNDGGAHVTPSLDEMQVALKAIRPIETFECDEPTPYAPKFNVRRIDSVRIMVAESGCFFLGYLKEHFNQLLPQKPDNAPAHPAVS